MALCPFMSGYDGAGYREVECKKGDCQLWDSENQVCGAFSTHYLKKILNSLHEENNPEKRSTGQLLKEIKLSLYDNCDENSPWCNGETLKGIYDKLCKCILTKHHIYAQEFMTMVDLDQNGKIYGKDFRLANPPPILKALEFHPDFNFAAEVVDEDI